MPKTNRGWSMGRQCKPAAEYDMRVARGLLQRESAHWPAYAVVTTPSAYAPPKNTSCASQRAWSLPSGWTRRISRT